MLGLIGGLGSALTLSGLLSDRIRLGEIVEIDGWRSNWSIRKWKRNRPIAK